jgi:hypothetical protein
MLTGLGRTKFLLILQLVWIGILVPAMVLGAHKDGILGAAYAHVAVIVPIVLPSYLLVLKRVTGVRLTTLGMAAMPALLASSAAALAAHGTASQFNSPLAQLIAGLAAGGGGVRHLRCTAMLSHVRAGDAAERVLRFYSTAARLVGFPSEGGAKHAARHSRGRAAEALNDTGPPQRSILAGQGRHLGADRVEDRCQRELCLPQIGLALPSRRVA